MKSEKSILAKEKNDEKSFSNFSKLREEEPKNESSYKELRLEDGKKIITYNDLLKETRLIDDEGKETVTIDPITVHEKESFDDLYNKIEMFSAMAEELIEEREESELNWDDEMEFNRNEIDNIREEQGHSHDDELER